MIYKTFLHHFEMWVQTLYTTALIIFLTALNNVELFILCFRTAGTQAAQLKSGELSGDLLRLAVDCNCISSSWITFVEIRDSCIVTATRRNFLALVITLFTVAFTACLRLVSNACDTVDFKLPSFRCRWSKYGEPLNNADPDGAINADVVTGTR